MSVVRCVCFFFHHCVWFLYVKQHLRVTSGLIEQTLIYISLFLKQLRPSLPNHKCKHGDCLLIYAVQTCLECIFDHFQCFTIGKFFYIANVIHSGISTYLNKLKNRQRLKKTLKFHWYLVSKLERSYAVSSMHNLLSNKAKTWDYHLS